MRHWLLGGATQIVSSGANFLFLLYLLRRLNAAEFGYFTFGNAVALFGVAILTSAFLLPLAVDAARAESQEQVVGAFLGAAALVWLGAALIIGISDALLIPTGYQGLAFATVFAIGGIFARDFFIRSGYSAGNHAIGLAINSVVALTLAVEVIVLDHAVEASARSALIIFGLAHFLGALVGYCCSNVRIGSGRATAVLRQIGSRGVWSVINTCFYFLRAHSYVWVGAALLGPIALGSMNAQRVLIAPAMILIAASGQVLLPRLARLASADIARFHQAEHRYRVCVLSISGAYSLLFFVLPNEWIAKAIGVVYADETRLAILWCIYLLLLAVRNSQEVAAAAQGRFQSMALSSAIAAIVSLVLTGVGAVLAGAAGALGGMVLSEGLFCMLLIRATSKC